MSDAEITLWVAVAKTVQQRQGALLPAVPVVVTPASPAGPPPPSPRRPDEEGRAPFLPPYVPPVQPRRGSQPPLAPFEKRFRQKVTRGRVDIEGVIDLHGMTQPQAHAALIGFVRASATRGARLVLVVTGKGRTRVASRDEPGVLRRAVPQWLRAEDLRPLVLGFEEAGLPHGGLGALYVRLRRRDG